MPLTLTLKDLTFQAVVTCLFALSITLGFSSNAHAWMCVPCPDKGFSMIIPSIQTVQQILMRQNPSNFNFMIVKANKIDLTGQVAEIHFDIIRTWPIPLQNSTKHLVFEERQRCEEPARSNFRVCSCFCEPWAADNLRAGRHYIIFRIDSRVTFLPFSRANQQALTELFNLANLGSEDPVRRVMQLEQITRVDPARAMVFAASFDWPAEHYARVHLEIYRAESELIETGASAYAGYRFRRIPYVGARADSSENRLQVPVKEVLRFGSWYTGPWGAVRAREDDIRVSKGLTKKEVLRGAHSYRNQLQSCYGQLLHRSPNAEGNLTILFTIGPDGRVSKANIATGTLDDSVGQECVTSQIDGWVFPRPRHGQYVNVLYSLNFYLRY